MYSYIVCLNYFNFTANDHGAVFLKTAYFVFSLLFVFYVIKSNPNDFLLYCFALNYITNISDVLAGLYLMFILSPTLGIAIFETAVSTVLSKATPNWGVI